MRGGRQGWKGDGRSLKDLAGAAQHTLRISPLSDGGNREGRERTVNKVPPAGAWGADGKGTSPIDAPSLTQGDPFPIASALNATD